jgi:hypothetical protein
MGRIEGTSEERDRLPAAVALLSAQTWIRSRHQRTNIFRVTESDTGSCRASTALSEFTVPQPS